MKEEKIKRLNCRVSEEEFKVFEKNVIKSNLTKSEFMRKSILGKEVIVIDEFKELIGVVTAKRGFYTLRHIFPKYRYIKTILQHIGDFIPFSFS